MKAKYIFARKNNLNFYIYNIKLTWFCNFETSWFKASFVLLKLLLRQPKYLGLARRVGLCFLVFVNMGPELVCGGGVRGGLARGIVDFKTLWEELSELGNAMSFNCTWDGTWEARINEVESNLFFGLLFFISRYLIGSVMGDKRVLVDLIVPC